jgi:hypothetical protein
MNTKGKVIVSYVILAIVIIGLVAFASNRHEKLKVVQGQAAQNVIAMTDTVKHYTDINGVIVAEKATMELTLDQLEIANDSLAQWIKDHPGDVEYIVKTEYVTIYDTIWPEPEDIIYNDDSTAVTLKFKHEEEQISLTASTSFSSPVPIVVETPTLLISDLIIEANLTTAIIEEDGIKTIHVSSDNPHVDITGIDGNVIPDDPVGFFDKFGIGLAVGPTFNYDLIDKDIAFGIGITAGFVYKKVKR